MDPSNRETEMSAILMFLNSSLGRAAMVGMLLAAAVASCSVQSARLKHAKADLQTAKAEQVDPHTKVRWEAEYEIAGSNLVTCKSDRDAFKADFDSQTRALDASKAASDQRDAAIASARQAAQRSALAAQSAGNLLAAYKLTTTGTCERLLEADRKVKELTQ